MKKNLVKIITALSIFAAPLFLTDIVSASQGTVELLSQTNDPTKCFAVSLRMQNLEYRILFSCQYLIYPVDDTVFNYTMWAQPKDGGKTVKLGAVGLGKGEFKTKTAFSSLFVTTEKDSKTKTPEGKVVLRGNVEPIKFLEEELTPTPTLTPQEEQENGEEVQEEEASPMTTKDKLLLALKRAGIAALFALVALIGVIYVVSRSRG